MPFLQLNQNYNKLRVVHNNNVKLDDLILFNFLRAFKTVRVKTVRYEDEMLSDLRSVESE